MVSSVVKEEVPELLAALPPPPPGADVIIDLSSSDSDSDVGGSGFGGGVAGKRSRDGGGGGGVKKVRATAAAGVLPAGFLDPLPPRPAAPVVAPAANSKQFWKAGDYDGKPLSAESRQPSGSGMDHVRVHPKFLHSNATSHKWALGALAELLDNSLDEVSSGATYVNIDMLENKKDGTRMLLVEDDGGGMDPNKMRQCMSLGYSAKSKTASTIGQYGNGFKTSTMRLGADVIVFSRSCGKEGKRPTQSIGMLSYTFLRSTGKEDIIVPMLDYEKGQVWKRIVRTTLADWNINLKTITKWSPYSTEADLLQQFSSMQEHGTRIVIFNLWEDDQGELELDFDADEYDIQIRGVNRDEKNIQMAEQFPNSKHFLTYRHSLRSYASILYLRLPHVFRIMLRGKEIEHHNIVNDMMLKQEVTYRPQTTDGIPKDPNMVAVVTIGFVKDAKHHVDVQGFNVYHKNRLIKPFWRVWTAAGSGGRGVIGVLEANFIEPAHDKQDFERTTILSRLETRLVQMQKTYWSTNSHRIGYAANHGNKNAERQDGESSPVVTPQPPSYRSGKDVIKSKEQPKFQHTGKSFSGSSSKNWKTGMSSLESIKSAVTKSRKFSSQIRNLQRAEKSERHLRSTGSRLGGISDSSDDSDPEFVCSPSKKASSHSLKTTPPQKYVQKGSACSPSPSLQSPQFTNPANGAVGGERITTRSQLKEGHSPSNENEPTGYDPETVIKQVKEENSTLKERISKLEQSMSLELQCERDKNKSLTEKLEDTERQLEVANKEQEALIDIFSEERNRRDHEEENLRKKLKDASATIQDLLEKLSAARNNHKV